ncbi:uncharacterized protein LOC121380065 [Gigantopelta aegis]|uniref:uncharacterized protein LOC121380065 n=1 Tax=Gigantopelta aegis TaxID=1735272 RepID=UPI001B88C5D1|nr:uncharacterized protein LOC121380065 [Gigantopelta aegis]
MIIDHLLSHQIVTNAMVEIVKVKGTLLDKIRALLDILARRQKGTFSVFCQALVLVGHQDLCQKLVNTMKSLDPSYIFLQIDSKSESTSGPNTGHVTTEQQTVPAVKQEDMEAECFQLNRVTIVSKIADENSLNLIIDHLLTQQIVTNTMMQSVNVKGTLSDKIRALLDILERRQKGTLSVFCQALVRTGHQELCQELEKTTKSLDPSYTFLQIDSKSESTSGPNTGHVTTEQQTGERL